jgi:hypothetical protein
LHIVQAVTVPMSKTSIETPIINPAELLK